MPLQCFPAGCAWQCLLCHHHLSCDGVCRNDAGPFQHDDRTGGFDAGAPRGASSAAPDEAPSGAENEPHNSDEAATDAAAGTDAAAKSKPLTDWAADSVSPEDSEA